MTLGALREQIRRRLNDAVAWSDDEIETAIRQGYRQFARATRCLWDMLYLENLPASFSYTQPWEAADAPYNAGLANFTYDDERLMLGPQSSRFGPANHTATFEATDGHLSDAGASTSIPATADLPTSVLDIERALWDQAVMDATTPTRAQSFDSRYELTEGEVVAYTVRKDGVRTFRKIRKPSAQASCYTVNGSWGALRSCTDLSADSVTGAWGAPRCIPGQHPMGASRFGIPRRPYRDGTNVRVEVWREGSPVAAADDTFEIPDRFMVAVREYALAQCYTRPSEGADPILAALHGARYDRHVARAQRRVRAQQRQRVGRMGGAQASARNGPPRPRLPWQYGSLVR